MRTDPITKANINIMGIPDGERMGKGAGSIFKEIVAWNFLNWEGTVYSSPQS